MKPRLYLDEDIMPLFAQLLRARGHDVVSAHEVGNTGLIDEDQLERATELGRAILSWNYNDFIRISHDCAANHIPHSGIIVSYHHYKGHEISAGVEIISNLMNAMDSEHLANCFIQLQDFR